MNLFQEMKLIYVSQFLIYELFSSLHRHSFLCIVEFATHSEGENIAMNIFHQISFASLNNLMR